MSNEMTVNEIIRNGWFKDASTEEVERIIKLSSIREYAADEFVYMSGAFSESLYCIIDGKVSLSIIDTNGDEFGLTLWTTGHWFGEAAFCTESRMPLQARALHGAKLLEVPISALDDALDDSAPFYRNIMLDMIERAKLLYSLVELLLFKPLRARVATRVLYLVKTFGEEEGGGVVLPIKFSQSDFAMMSGGSRQRINQIFRKWADQDIFVKRNKRYVVLDIEALNKEAEATED